MTKATFITKLMLIDPGLSDKRPSSGFGKNQEGICLTISVLSLTTLQSQKTIDTMPPPIAIQFTMIWDNAIGDSRLFVLNYIEGTKTKANSPQTNAICERFHKMILEEFYEIVFRKKIYNSLEKLQIDLAAWLHHYNHQRIHQGKMCCRRTPIETFLDGKRIWQNKVDKLNLN